MNYEENMFKKSGGFIPNDKYRGKVFGTTGKELTYVLGAATQDRVYTLLEYDKDPVYGLLPPTEDQEILGYLVVPLEELEWFYISEWLPQASALSFMGEGTEVIGITKEGISVNSSVGDHAMWYYFMKECGVVRWRYAGGEGPKPVLNNLLLS